MSDEKMREAFEKSGYRQNETMREVFYDIWQASAAHSAARIAELEGQVAMLRDAGDHVIENLGNQYHTNGGGDFYQIRHEVIAVLGEALDDATAQTAEEYRRRVQAEAEAEALELRAEVWEAIGYSKFKTPAEELRHAANELRNQAGQAVSGSVTFTASTTWSGTAEGKGEK